MEKDNNQVTQAEKYLLDKIRLGDSQAWSEFVDRYRGRLLTFARSRGLQKDDAEDAVQETFVAFIKNLKNYRYECTLETYLFSLLRFKVIDNYRHQKAKHYCLIQDAYGSGCPEPQSDPMETIAGSEQTASWYCRADENYNRQKDALTSALSELVEGLKSSLNFRDLQIVELVFYCGLSNKTTSEILGLKDANIALIKHRSIKQLQEKVTGLHLPDEPSSREFEHLLSDIWKLQRFSCPKRSTIGAFLLGTLAGDWHNYIDFHLNKVGCGFCRANLEDIKQQNKQSNSVKFRSRIMESTAGFLKKSL